MRVRFPLGLGIPLPLRLLVPLSLALWVFVVGGEWHEFGQTFNYDNARHVYDRAAQTRAPLRVVGEELTDRGSRFAMPAPGLLATSGEATLAAKAATSGAELLSGAARATYRGDLTVAGRALAKHGGRPGSAFPRPVGAPANISAQAQSAVDDILANQYRRATSFNPRLNGKVVDIFDASGRGLRYTEEGRFVGFLEPPR